MRKVFRRSSSGSSSKSKGNGIKIEYYKRHEIPRSKFKGPFDREHQRKLAAWSFGEAQAERPRTPDLCLSPCASIPDYLRSHYEDDEALAPDQIPTAAPELDVTVGMWDASPRQPSGSSSSLDYYHNHTMCDDRLTNHQHPPLFITTNMPTADRETVARHHRRPWNPKATASR